MPKWDRIVYLGDLWEGVRTQTKTVTEVAEVTTKRLRAVYPRLAELAEEETPGDSGDWADLQEAVEELEALGKEEAMTVSHDDLDKIMDRVWDWADTGNRLWIDFLNGPGTARGRI